MRSLVEIVTLARADEQTANAQLFRRVEKVRCFECEDEVDAKKLKNGLCVICLAHWEYARAKTSSRGPAT